VEPPTRRKLNYMQRKFCFHIFIFFCFIIYHVLNLVVCFMHLHARCVSTLIMKPYHHYHHHHHHNRRRRRHHYCRYCSLLVMLVCFPLSVMGHKAVDTVVKGHEIN
jgi:hypothetical protein